MPRAKLGFIAGIDFGFFSLLKLPYRLTQFSKLNIQIE